MNERTKRFDYLSDTSINNSINTSKIPKFLNKIISDFNVRNSNESIQQNHKFWKKFGSKNLNGKQSRIPVFKPKISIKENYSQNQQNFETNNLFEKPFNSCLIESTKSESNNEFGVKFRSVVGRSSTTNGWTKSEPIDCLKNILEIVRSNSSADIKFRAIKRYRDKRLGIIHQMDSYSDNTFDDRVNQWVDSSGYISNDTNFRLSDDVFDANLSKSESTPNTSNPIINQRDPNSRRRSYNNMRAMDLIALNKNYNSFNSDLSMSSISSIESLLDSRREDPEELLLALGFGYQPENQTLNRIPQRFFESPSSAKGVNPDNVRKMFGTKDIPSLSSSTSFPSTDLRERSYSCGRISERFQKRLNSKDSIMKTELPEIITSSCSSILQTESILNPANRKFLESQGKEQQNQLSSKRLIIGTKSYKLDIDGDPLAVFPKTPSPQSTTPVPPDSDMEMQPTIDEQINVCPNDDNNLSQIPKRNPFYRQNCITENQLNDQIIKKSMNELSSDLSSSTTTLVGTVVSHSSNEMPVHSFDFESDDKRNAFSQTERQRDGNQFIEAALVVAIQSLRLSLEFYSYQSIKIAKISSQKYNESSNLTEEELFNLSKIQELRESIHKEIVDMDLVLNRHLQVVHSSDVVDTSFISQAQVFTEAIKKVRQLLKEQHNLYSQMGLIKLENY